MIAKPADLADHVFKYLEKNIDGSVPSQGIFNELFDCLFYASLQKEEAESIQATIVYYDHDAPRPSTKRFKPENWSFTPFKKPISLTVANLVKLSKAADPWSTTIAIHSPSSGQLFITGLIDQAIHQQSYLNMEDDTRPDFPGVFHVSIEGTGHLTVYSDFGLVATLKQDKLVHRYLNVFNQGPVADILEVISNNLNDQVRQHFDNEEVDTGELEYRFAKTKIILRHTLSRILNKIKTYGHGGALLISSDETDLTIKYPLFYDRLNTTIVDLKKNATLKNFSTAEDDESDPEDDAAYRKLLYRELLYTKELKGAIRFVASQSRVDGLILMDDHFHVKGFGTVITELKYPRSIYVSTTLTATPSSLEKRPPDQFGTRHRTMFAFCQKHPGSLGFVISQDGDVRAITRVDGKVVMWENIQLQKFSKKGSLIG